MAERTVMIEQIYDRRADQYRDIRSIHTEKAMTKRIEEIKKFQLKIPERERNEFNLRYKKLSLELGLLSVKRQLYTRKEPALTLWLVQLSDKHYYDSDDGQDKAVLKKGHILPLLTLVLSNKSDDDLRIILNRIEERDLARNK